jgi:hypothetical protein
MLRQPLVKLAESRLYPAGVECIASSARLRESGLGNVSSADQEENARHNEYTFDDGDEHPLREAVDDLFAEK